MSIPIIGGLIDLGREVVAGWVNDRRSRREADTQIAQAELNRDVAAINAQATQIAQNSNQEFQIDLTNAQSAARSWKDEYLTILLTVPAIMCFVPGGAQYVTAGFAALDTAPEWYMLSFAAMITFVFGVRHLLQRWPTRR